MLEITTLGNFSVKQDGKSITDKSVRTQKLWKLLSILIVNRKKPSSVKYIIDSIWGNEECENPTKALHNLIFRLRKLFSSQTNDENNSDHIIFMQDCYSLNFHNESWIDIYEMEDIHLKVTENNLPIEEKIKLLNKIISLYNGRFLLDLYEETWAQTAAEHYERIFVSSVIQLSDLYFDMRKYDKAIHTCNKAIELEILEEQIYLRLIKSTQHSGQRIHAIAICEGFFERLRKDIGVRASDEMMELYSDLRCNKITSLKNDDIPAICERIKKKFYEEYAAQNVMINVEIKILSDNCDKIISHNFL